MFVSFAKKESTKKKHKAHSTHSMMCVSSQFLFSFSFGVVCSKTAYTRRFLLINVSLLFTLNFQLRVVVVKVWPARERALFREEKKKLRMKCCITAERQKVNLNGRLRLKKRDKTDFMFLRII